MGLERLEKLDDLLFLATALIQPEQAVGATDSGNCRNVVTAEVKLNDGRWAFDSLSRCVLERGVRSGLARRRRRSAASLAGLF